MTQRFVILAHTVNGATHYDLMLEVAGQEKLRTYQLSRWPLAVGESCECRQLDDHRRAYLDYEGEVSGGRGIVERISRGVWTGDLQLVPEQGDTCDLDIAISTATRRA